MADYPSDEVVLEANEDEADSAQADYLAAGIVEGG